MQPAMKAAKWLLCTQLAFTVAAAVLAGVSLTSSTPTVSPTSDVVVVGGALVSAPVVVCAVLLIAAAVLGLVALRRPKLYLRAGIVLLTPLVLAVATSLSAALSALPGEDVAGLQFLSTYEVWPSIQQKLRLLEWSSWLVFGAALLAAVSALILLQLRRKHATS